MEASMDSQNLEPGSNTENLFIAKQQLRLLTQSLPREKTSKTTRPLFNDLVYCACRPNSVSAKKTLGLINQQADLAQQFAWVLNKLSFTQSGAQVAASSEMEIEERSNDKFEIRIKQDRLMPNQAYITLKIKSDLPNTQQGLYLHLLRDNQFFVLHFPELIDSKTQLVVDKDSQSYALLCHVETQIFIQQH
jgi:hypothetical protein